jgi:hypothetical protein
MADNFAVRSYKTNPITFPASSTTYQVAPRTYSSGAPAAPVEPVGGLGAAMGQTSDLYSFLQQQAEDRERQISEMYEPVLSRWDRMAEDLRKRQMGPTRTERLWQLAQAFATPTKTGTAGTLGNVASVLGGQATTRREVEDERQRLLEQYGSERDNLMLQQRQAMLQAQNVPQEALIEMMANANKSTYDPYAGGFVSPGDPRLGIKPTFRPATSGPALQGNVPQISSPEQYAALPPGTRFMAPDGTIRVKP